MAGARRGVPRGRRRGVWGTPRLGIDARGVARALRPVALPVGVEALVTAGAVLALRAAGADTVVTAVVAALTGIAVLAVLLARLRSSPLPEGLTVLGEALGRPTGAPQARS